VGVCEPIIYDRLASMYAWAFSQEKEYKQLSKALSDAEKKTRDLAKGHRRHRDDQVIYKFRCIFFY